MQSKIYDNRKCEKSHFLFLCNKKFLQNKLKNKNVPLGMHPCTKEKILQKQYMLGA